ncbi:hypothetical protein CC2G_004201 [Coprinopsis cinerea AmutBmut pab1-1]|nr:hypothetical protein CC2G_004201 [Coprinopsis cinerea AmutBmut pab1-1]
MFPSSERTSIAPVNPTKVSRDVRAPLAEVRKGTASVDLPPRVLTPSPGQPPHRCSNEAEGGSTATDDTPSKCCGPRNHASRRHRQEGTELAEEDHIRRTPKPAAADLRSGHEVTFLDDYPPMGTRAREEYTYARNRHTFASMFSRVSKDEVTQNALNHRSFFPSPDQPTRHTQTAHCGGPAGSETSALSPLRAPPLQNLAEYSRALSQARGENIAQTNDVAFQLGATILHCFELVQMLIDLQHDRKCLDEGLITVNASLNERFQEHPNAAQLSSMLSSFLHHQTIGVIVNPNRPTPPSSPSSRHSRPQTPFVSTQLSVSQIRHLGFSYSANPIAIADHINDMWSHA